QEGLTNQLAVLSPVAVRMLHLRELIQLVPQAPVKELLPMVEQQIVAKLAKVPIEALTVETFVRTVARQGGFLGRRSDGHPGWKSLWEGWFQIQLMVQGAQIVTQAPP
ncbi:MAG TPA: IS4 family transposase, partial [Ktedonobacteraceae bacterium]|nr:IS4 family transposase [Ktedonobacteraceae bacterium]